MGAVSSSGPTSEALQGRCTVLGGAGKCHIYVSLRTHSMQVHSVAGLTCALLGGIPVSNKTEDQESVLSERLGRFCVGVTRSCRAKQSINWLLSYKQKT